MDEKSLDENTDIKAKSTTEFGEVFSENELCFKKKSNVEHKEKRTSGFSNKFWKMWKSTI